MEKKNFKVTIIILNFNGKTDTLECLSSIEKLNTKHLTISTIVVDNNSKDDSIEEIKSNFPDVHLIKNNKNLGFCKGNNIGIRKALKQGADYLLILNNDTYSHPLLIKELVKTAQETKSSIVCPKIYFAKGFEFHRDRYNKEELGKVIWYAGGLIDWKNILISNRGVDEVDNGQYDEVKTTEVATGCAMLVRSGLFEKIGFFDPVYFAYFEDADFSVRAKHQDEKITYSPKAIVWHKNASSFGGSGSKFQDYFVTRNRIIFGLRFAPLRSKIALLREAINMLFDRDKIRRNAVVDGILRRMPSEKKLGKLITQNN